MKPNNYSTVLRSITDWAAKRKNGILISTLAAIPILAATLIKANTNATLEELTRDPAIFLNRGPYIGLLSQIGLIYWISAAAICLFSSYSISKLSPANRYVNFLKFTGLFSLLMSIDDAFLLHDFFAPYYFKISEKIVYLAYGILFTLVVLAFRRIIVTSNYYILVFALIAFAASVLMDSIEFHHDLATFAEDGLKLLGIACWMTYLADTCANAIISQIHGQNIES